MRGKMHCPDPSIYYCSAIGCLLSEEKWPQELQQKIWNYLSNEDKCNIFSINSTADFTKWRILSFHIKDRQISAVVLKLLMRDYLALREDYLRKSASFSAKNYCDLCSGWNNTIKHLFDDVCCSYHIYPAKTLKFERNILLQFIFSPERDLW
jgi:hypothetical protein